MSPLSRYLLCCLSKKGVHVQSYHAQALTHLSLHVNLLLTARIPVVAALAPVKRTLNLRAQTRFVKTTLPRVETVSSGASRAVSTRAS